MQVPLFVFFALGKRHLFLEIVKLKYDNPVPGGVIYRECKFMQPPKYFKCAIYWMCPGGTLLATNILFKPFITDTDLGTYLCFANCQKRSDKSDGIDDLKRYGFGE